MAKAEASCMQHAMESGFRPYCWRRKLPRSTPLVFEPDYRHIMVPLFTTKQAVPL